MGRLKTWVLQVTMKESLEFHEKQVVDDAKAILIDGLKDFEVKDVRVVRIERDKD